MSIPVTAIAMAVLVVAGFTLLVVILALINTFRHPSNEQEDSDDKGSGYLQP